MLELVPDSKRDAVSTALREAFGTATVDSAQLLAGGLSSALVYRIEVKGRPYVLRVVVNASPMSDPIRHVTCLRTAVAAGLAPALHHADTASGLTISDFVDATPMAAFQRPRAALLSDLAGVIRTLQVTPPFPPVMNYLDGLAKRVTDVRATGRLPTWTNEAFDRIAAIVEGYPRNPADLVSSHNDLNPGNCLWDGQRLWIIDWEAAFLNDRYVDPALVCNFFTATSEEEAGFLAAYFGRPPTAHEKARIYLMRQACQAFFAVIILQIAGRARPELRLPADARASAPLRELRRKTGQLLASSEGQIDLGLALLEEIANNGRTAAFAEALNTLEG